MNTAAMINLVAPQPQTTQFAEKDTYKSHEVSEKSFQETMYDKTEAIDRNQQSEEKSTIKDDVKTQKESDSTQKHIQKGESVLSQKVESTQTVDEELQQVEQQIMQLLAMHLQVSPEVIAEHMQKLGQNAMQMLNQSDLMLLVQSVLQIDPQALLQDASMVREIGKLWESLEQVENEVVAEGGKLQELVEALGKPTHNDTIQTDNAQNSATQTGDSSTQNYTDPIIATQQPEVIQQTSLGHTTQQQDKEARDGATGEGVLEVLTSETSEFVLPVQNILEAQTAKMWQQSARQATGMTPTQHAPINKQILDQVDFVALKDGKELTVDLNPKELGKLTLKVSEHNGIVTTVIKVETERAKEMLLENIQVLKESLAEQGLEVGGFQVDVKQHTNHQQMEKEKQKSSKRIQEIIDKHMNAIEEEVVPEEQLTVTTSKEFDRKA